MVCYTKQGGVDIPFVYIGSEQDFHDFDLNPLDTPKGLKLMNLAKENGFIEINNFDTEKGHPCS
ncbi:MAG: hypothetical protein H7196_01720 [candidate division SR1 bacterium]|nr:hypothetical protein [candidate division SR1 bacterium]